MIPQNGNDDSWKCKYLFFSSYSLQSDITTQVNAGCDSGKKVTKLMPGILTTYFYGGLTGVL